ncbi:MAG: SHOCT domain-containing protein [Thermoleophilia bacterium]|nr:SHOCT domain-containing protein [Thermoleophilia bacterium]
MFARRGPGLIGMAARTAVVAGTATAVSGRVARRQAERYAQQDAAYLRQQAAAVERGIERAAVPAAAPSYVAELEQLAQLRAQGILSDEEFEAKKKQILGI